MNRKLTIWALAACLGAALCLIPLQAHEGEDHAEHGSDTVAVEGEVLDLACYLSHGAKGSGHAKCAVACVKGGQPMGLLAADGTLYLLYASHSDSTPYDAVKEHAGRSVTIEGKPGSRDGMKGIEVAAVKAD